MLSLLWRSTGPVSSTNVALLCSDKLCKNIRRVFENCSQALHTGCFWPLVLGRSPKAQQAVTLCLCMHSLQGCEAQNVQKEG